MDLDFTMLKSFSVAYELDEADKIKPEVIITRYGSIRIKKEARPKNASLSFLSLIIIFLKELIF